MRKSLRAAALGAACVVAGAALYGSGVASAGQSTANSTHEPYNIGLLTKDIDTYYGTTLDSNGVYQASATSPYAQDLARIDASAKRYIDAAVRKHHKGVKPAVVFDIDDTLLLSLDYEKKNNYGYSSASWAAYVAQANRPEVFGTPAGQVRRVQGRRRVLQLGPVRGAAHLRGRQPEEGRRRRQPRRRPHVPQEHGQPAVVPEQLRDRRRLDLHHRAVQVRYPEAHRVPRLRHHRQLRRPVLGPRRGYADKTYKLPNPTYFVS